MITEMRLASNRLAIAFFITILLFAFSCTPKEKHQKQEKHRQQNRSLHPRDWNRFPAIIERSTSAEVIALGDIHGGYQRLVNLLSMAGLIKSDKKSPVGYSWSGGNRLLISTGDLIDKGDHSIEVIDLMIALEAQAPASGGEIVITLGNHEAEFLVNPGNKKADEFRSELQSKGINPESLPKGQQPYGEWMMNRPFAARVNDWFFAHGGNTSGKPIGWLAESFRKAVDQGEWDSPLLIGDDSLLEAQKWWKGQGKAKVLLDNYLNALGVRHIVFGHDPGAFDNKGEIGQAEDGRIFLIDAGMSPAIDYSNGALLLIDVTTNEVVAASLTAGGIKKELWREMSSKPSH